MYKLKCLKKNFPLKKTIFTLNEKKIKNNSNTIYKPKFYEINGKISFPYIAEDSNLLHSVNNENLINLKSFLNNKLEKKNQQRKYLF